MKKHSLRYSFAACLLLLFSVLCGRTHAQPASQASQAASTSSLDAAIPAAQLLQPEELVQMLRSSGEKPLVLQVGSHVLYAEAHIPGSEYAGAGGQEAGLQTLRDRVKGLDRSQSSLSIVDVAPGTSAPISGPHIGSCTLSASPT